MSSRTAFALVTLILGPAIFASAQDWEGIAASSTRSQDHIIIQAIAAQDAEAQLAICRGLGRRPDSNVQAVIESLIAASSPAVGARTELLLRWLLASARSNHPRDEDLRAWIAANQPSMDGLWADMRHWRAPMLRAELVWMAAVAEGAAPRRAVSEAGAGIVQRLEGTEGLLSGEETALALAFLEAARRSAAADLLSPCADIARLSRDKAVVDAAREAAAAAAK